MAYRFVEPFEDVGNGITPAGGAKLFFFDVGTSNAKTTYADFGLTTPNPDPVVANINGVFPDIFLDTDADRTLRDKNDELIYGPDTVHAPDSSIAAIAAAIVTVADAGGLLDATDVEAALAEIATDWMKKARAETISGTKTFSGADINLADNLLIRPEIKDYGVTHNSVSSSSGTVVLDLSTGNSFVTTLTENITTVTLSNPPATGMYGQLVWKIIQDGGGGAYTVTFPASVLWPSGTGPTITTSNDAIDEVTLRTTDAGTEWRGSFSQAFS